MAAITDVGVRAHTVTLSGTTAKYWTLTGPVNQLEVINHGAAAAFVRLYTAKQPVTDDAGLTPAVADADELYMIPGAITSGSMGRRVILKTPRDTYVYGSVVANGNKVTFEGFNWY